MNNWNSIPSKEIVEKTAEALKANGFDVFIVQNAVEAKKKALELIPTGSEVFTASSVTVDSIGLGSALNETGIYDSVKTKMYKMDQKKEGRKMRKMGAGPDFAVGSVHAVTGTGTLLIASLTGSQLPAYAYGAGTVIYVVSTKKIVPTLDDAWKRLEEHVMPLESERARKAYGLPEGFKTFPSKVLVMNREVQPGRVKIILMNEDAGF